MSATPSHAYATRKLAYCVRLARDASRDSWQEPKRYQKENRRIARESMQDARYWKGLLSKQARCADCDQLFPSDKDLVDHTLVTGCIPF